jgi:hypothetical protein
VYLIDEAQMIFPSTFKNEAVGNWLQWHGHLGQDIFFMTQDLELLPRNFVVLAEDLIKALPRTSVIFSSRTCQYNRINKKGDVNSKFGLRKKKEIFALYKSQSATETEKIAAPMTKMLVAAGVFFVIVTGYSAGKMWGVFQPAEKSENSNLPVASRFARAIPLPPPPVVAHPVAKFVDTYLASQPLNSLVVAPGVSWEGLDYIKSDEKFLILFRDRIYTLADFPYPTQWHGRRLSALIPDADLQRLPPTSQPFTPPVAGPASLGREQAPATTSPFSGFFPST